MSEAGTEDNPLRVAVVGSGPAGFYTVSHLLKIPNLHVEIDMFERLPTPFGLVRAGVAPDHQKYKTVTRKYDQTAADAGFRFFGNVEFGSHVSLEDLQRHYHQIVFTTGAPSDRNLGIPGESLRGSYPATEFVAWYNGHPDYADHEFDLDVEAAAIVGIGNVAVDVARMLCKTDAELRTSDMADHALEALRRSNVRKVYLLGRRGPAQAAFTPPEIQEMGELEATDVTVLPEEATVDAESRADLEQSGDRNAQKNVAIIERFAETPHADRERELVIRFLVSPIEILGDDDGHVRAIRIVRNEMVRDDKGTLRPRPTDVTEEIPVGIVFRSVGYRGIAPAGLPYDENRGTIRNVEGRVTDETGTALTGLYTAGWIKRGPTGVIGTNKSDAKETVNHMIADLREGRLLNPDAPAVAAVEKLLAERQPQVVSYEDWRRIDAIETERGRASERPRVKFTRIEAMMDALER